MNLWGPTLEQPVPEGLHPMEGTHAGAVCGGLSPMGGAPSWSRGRVLRSPSPEENGAAETTCDELTITPVLCPPALLGGGGRENWE